MASKTQKPAQGQTSKTPDEITEDTENTAPKAKASPRIVDTKSGVVVFRDFASI